MAFLYITEQGAVLRKEYNHLRLLKDKQTILEIPCADVEHVMIFGNIQVTTPALQELAKSNIEIAFFTRRGKLLFQLTSRFPKNILLRQRQYHLQADPAFCLAFSKTIVAAKLKSAADVARNYLKKHPSPDSNQAALETIDTMKAGVEQASSLKTLLGIEGSGAAAYYKIFATMLKKWSFNGRVRRPPRDPVNALLSFGYVLVANEIASHLDGSGFDPFLGFYHTVDYGRNSLALDLLEEFRHPLVDRFTLHLLNHNILKQEHFEQTAREGVGHFRKHFKTQIQKLASFLQQQENKTAYEPFQLR